MVVCLAAAVPAVRAGSQQVFLTAAIDFAGAVTTDDLLRDAAPRPSAPVQTR